MLDRRLVFLGIGALLGFAAFGMWRASVYSPPLNPLEMEKAVAMAISSLGPVPPDPSNAVADDPRAAKLGERLFFDTGLSANQGISCATCHEPDKQFQDLIPLAFGIGQVLRRTMHLEGAQWGNWFFWDGRKDSQWSQALGPFESPVEHGMTRDMVARHVIANYKAEYEALFGPAPDTGSWPFFASPLVEGPPAQNWEAAPPEVRDAINRVFANAGKAIAAFQRTLMPRKNRFDRFVEAVSQGRQPAREGELTSDEIAGFRLFTGKARCDNCHSGPLMSDFFFHNTGVPTATYPVDPQPGTDWGRAAILPFIKAGPFACTGDYSDAEPDECRELRFMSEDPAEFEGSFKTPGLRGVAARAPYMHAGQFATLEEVVDHYDQAPDPHALIPDIMGRVTDHGRHAATEPLGLTGREKRQLIAFLKLL